MDVSQPLQRGFRLGGQVPAQLRDQSLFWIAVGLGILGLASGVYHVVSPFDGSSDVAWLIAIGEKVLSGQRLYGDILEANPPMSLLLYLPPIWLAQQTGIAAELMVHGWVLFWAAVSLVMTFRLSGAAGLDSRAGQYAFCAVAAYVLLVLPARTFGQREHFAVIGLLPYLMLIAARWNGKAELGLRRVLVVGVLAGLSFCIKPHFALIMALPALAMAFASRRVMALISTENIVAGVIAVAYLLVVLAVYPEFINVMMPLTALVYLPSRLAPGDLMAAPSSLLALAVITVVVIARSHFAAALPRVLLAAAAGALAVYLIQAKGWPYHQLPALSLGFLAIAAGFILSYRSVVSAGIPVRDGVALIALAALMGFFGPRLFCEHTETKQLEALIRKHSAAPSLIIASSNVGVHFPLVRRVNGRWESRLGSLWVSEGVARVLPLTLDVGKREALKEAALKDRKMFAEDAVKARPDMIGLAYVDAKKNMLAWAHEEPDLKRLLTQYREVGVANDILLLVRNDLLDKPQVRN